MSATQQQNMQQGKEPVSRQKQYRWDDTAENSRKNTVDAKKNATKNNAAEKNAATKKTHVCGGKNNNTKVDSVAKKLCVEFFGQNNLYTKKPLYMETSMRKKSNIEKSWHNGVSFCRLKHLGGETFAHVNL